MENALAESWMKLEPAYRRKLMAASSTPQLLREFTTKEGTHVRITFSLAFPEPA